MKLNQATDYAFRMVLHMSMMPEGFKITGSELAGAEMIPERFLLKIMRMLIQAEIMQSFRGVEGGFALKKNPKDINLLDVIRAVEGEASCNKSCMGHCAVNEAMATIQDELASHLREVNFADLAEREKEIQGITSLCACGNF